MQHNNAKNKTNSTKSPDKKLLNINLAYLESDDMTDVIFGMTASVEKNYHIASDEIDRIFDGNIIHCTEVKQYTYDDSEHLKYLGSPINLATVTIRFQEIQIDQHSSQHQRP